MTKPMAVDLCCGLGGWTEGLLAEGWDVVGFDIEQHVYGEHCYPAQLVLQNILTLDGQQFRGKVSLIVASPPCQFFSYTAMPWTRAKELAKAVRADPARLEKELALFNACVRIGKEAECPIVIENVRGAQPWVGRSKWAWGSFHLWGDVPALMPITGRTPPKRAMDDLKYGQRKSLHSHLPVGNGPLGRNDGTKAGKANADPDRMSNWGRDGEKIGDRNAHRASNGELNSARFTNSDEQPTRRDGVKVSGDWFGDYAAMKASGTISPGRMHGKGSSARKAASARIAKIPFALASHIARIYYPTSEAVA